MYYTEVYISFVHLCLSKRVRVEASFIEFD